MSDDAMNESLDHGVEATLQASTNVVWKFPMEFHPGVQQHSMPVGAKILHVEEQAGRPVMWAQVNPIADTEVRSFKLVGTGHADIYSNDGYVGTALTASGAFVWHVYEVKA